MSHIEHRARGLGRGMLRRAALAACAALALYAAVWIGWNLSAPALFDAPAMTGRSALGATLLVFAAAFVLGGRRARPHSNRSA
jgi:hypothetical protein